MTNLQIELLKLYSTDLTEEELKQLKTQLAKFFADKAVKEAEKVWQEKGLSQDVMEQWLREET
ncbi:MAG: hypothetical protein DRP41_02440 [Thermodesulfobacteriota bacterium]|nr:MAG: hypothetical protein DRP41_02440 [Thermodesulfobacteriota bacterium]